MVADGGWLLATTPQSYRRTLDPMDNRLRVTPAELIELFDDRGERLEIRDAVAVEIRDDRYYRGLLSHASWVQFGASSWFPLPGVTERIRYRVPRLRWRESCVLLRRPGTARPDRGD